MVTTILAGLSLGAVYAIVAIGYNIVFVASGVFNFAQAQFLMLGTFVALVAGQQLHLPLVLAIVLCAVVGAIVGGLEEFLTIRRLSGKGADNQLITTLGVATVLSGIALAIFGSDPQQVIYFHDTSPVTLLGGVTTVVDMLILAVSVVLAATVGVVTRRSIIGLASLAAAEDRQAAQLRGVSVSWLAFGAFVLAGGLVAAVGPLVGAKTYANYALGDDLAVKAFVALAIGGFGSYLGAVVGGLSVGLLEMMSARYLGTDWHNIGVFLMLVVVLVVLPNGIFSRAKERSV